MTAAHQYTATVIWSRREEERFVDNRYSRAHEWRFDGGATVPASASPLHVRQPMSNPAGVDPEEAFVAALSSCHMLFFLHHAAKKGLVVDRYEDDAIGTMGQNARGASAITEVVLRPHVSFSGKSASAEELRALHEQSHHDCYIANSVTADVKVVPR